MKNERSEGWSFLKGVDKVNRATEREEFPSDVLPTGRWLSNTLTDFNQPYFRNHPLQGLSHWEGLTSVNGRDTHINIDHFPSGLSRFTIKQGGTVEQWSLDEHKGLGAHLSLDTLRSMPTSAITPNLNGLRFTNDPQNRPTESTLKEIFLFFKTPPRWYKNNSILQVDEYLKSPEDLPVRTVSDIDYYYTNNFIDNRLGFKSAKQDKPWQFASIEEGIQTLLKLRHLIETSSSLSKKSLPLDPADA